jgi:hypothetical protein
MVAIALDIRDGHLAFEVVNEVVDLLLCGFEGIGGFISDFMINSPVSFIRRMGTVFESSHVPLHIWLQAIFFVAGSKKGVSSNQLHQMPD